VTRRIRYSTKLKVSLDFPQVGQVFQIEREFFHKKTKSAQLKRHWTLPVGRLRKLMLTDYKRLIEGIGLQKIPVTILSTGTMKKITVKFL